MNTWSDMKWLGEKNKEKFKFWQHGNPAEEIKSIASEDKKVSKAWKDREGGKTDSDYPESFIFVLFLFFLF